ncbi:MAG: universal stress protein [Pseudodesulfovibrio sp.]|uniref:UspA domain-containing protein n=1 Tax=Pseudodesulfovibrio aespoeensis (strain ATCC 700646 / DSM 10631 / Aspo-2) TaxID=643562 RepID=E6VTM6_PSEA9|nr:MULTISPECIES: universal stress protein [Pseudodesulfovibrio]MBU4377764.1 universal stress protein [Pseudomonadota bacterium]ADU63313.1 UspA domain-containing protein [Pseudodesulfovibrio aespoeensis Aspo-2]MBU4474949.1 universal stress protein [Pseudomonadota bacterium]MBU4516116.1 universal stress protein [Pseudomonadota bacterium]MBU4523487.1 universal stress protein [Pseudomonadota bacterium]
MLPNIKNILYATDLSANARLALGFAAVLADRHDAEVTVLHVLPDSLELLSEEAGMDLAQTFGEKAAYWIDKGEKDKAIQAIHERLEGIAREEFTTPGSPAHLAGARIKVVCGDAAQRIVAETESGNFDMVVMGTHGQTGLMGILLGSVATETIRHCKIPILVVPLPE